MHNTHFEAATNSAQDNFFIESMTDSDSYAKAKTDLCIVLYYIV
jgi:hypothetical protein